MALVSETECLVQISFVGVRLLAANFRRRDDTQIV